MSTLVDGLVTRGLVSREPSPKDRRRIALCLTARGQSTLAAARRATQAGLARLLAALSNEDQVTVANAMRALRPLFVPRTEEEAEARSA